MTIKISKDKLFAFLNKVKMANTQAVTEIVLSFTDDGLKSYKNSESNTARVEGVLDKEAFEEYEAVGDVGVRRLDILVKLLNRFKKDITIDVTGNIMTISQGKKSVGMELVADGVINKDDLCPDLEYDNTFKFDSKELKDIFEDAKLSNDACIIVEVDAGKVTFKNTGKYKFTNSYDREDCIINSKVKVGKPFVDAVTNLTGELTIKVKTDNPIEVLSTDDNEEVKVIVAPMVED